MRAQITNRDYEQISAYLDGQLAAGDRKKLEERLRARPELQSALEEIRRTRALLRMAPKRRAPRNFTLTPAMAEEVRPRRKSSWSFFPALSFASAIATLALVVSFFLNIPGAAPALRAAAPAQMTTASESGAADQAMSTQAAAAPAAGGMTNQAAPAEPGINSAEANGQAQSLEAPQAKSGAAPAGAAPAQPPIVNWGSPDGLGGGMATGRGGGGSDSIYGMGGGAPDGRIVVPPQGINSLVPEQSQAASPNNVKPNPNIVGGGPILGVPEKDDAGQIISESSNMGQPPANTAPEREQSGSSPAAMDRRLFGLPALWVIQGLLAALAVGTALAAVLVRRKGA